jgi:hypothetical protein
VDVLVPGLPEGAIYVAVDRGVVAITSPDAGEVRQPAPFGGGFAQKGPAPMEFSIWKTRASTDPVPESASQKRLPAGVARSIQRPGAAVLARGSLFMVDEGAGWVCVALRQQRWTKLAPATPVSRPTGLLPLGDTLLVLDGDRGVLERWPLPVPTDIDLGREIRPALDALYSRLLERRALATRRVAWRGTLDQTLREEGFGDATQGSKVPSIVCALNPGVCVQDQWRPPVAGKVVVPDVPIDRVVDLATIETAELADGRTIGDEVGRRIVSPDFNDYRSGAELIELNASRLSALQKAPTYGGKQSWGPYDANNILGLRQKDFPPGFTLTVPTEKQRALVALPRPLLRDDAWLSDIRLISPSFNWTPYEETEAKTYGADPQPPPSPAPGPSPCDMNALKRERADLVTTIHHTLPPNLPTVKVGVLEVGGIDVQHPAFGGANVAFSYISAPPPPAPPVTDPPTCGAATTADDHGTAVAGLIASRQDGLAGFAPNVQIVPLRSTDDVVGDELFAAFRDRKVRIFNLSLHYREKLVKNIRRRIHELDALFVVAAGNDPTDQKPVCESIDPYPAYPVCEGDRPNVLVVAATTFQGNALIDPTVNPPAAGSNWNENVVQIAAPGTGYHAPSRNNGYAPVSGTSFAAPLVTATAALLFAEGVTDPWLIKQRIIATADQKVNLLGKVFGAGLLNVERAVTAPQFAILTKGTATKRVDLQLGPQSNAISISWAGGSRTLPLANVRRLTKNQTGGTYRIVYLDDVTNRLIVQTEIDSGSWPFKYQVVDAGTGAVAPAIVADQIENYDDYVGPVS